MFRVSAYMGDCPVGYLILVAGSPTWLLRNLRQSSNLCQNYGVGHQKLHSGYLIYAMVAQPGYQTKITHWYQRVVFCRLFADILTLNKTEILLNTEFSEVFSLMGDFPNVGTSATKQFENQVIINIWSAYIRNWQGILCTRFSCQWFGFFTGNNCSIHHIFTKLEMSSGF